MAFHERMYVAYVVLGDPTTEPLWKWHRWQEFVQAFDPVVGLCRGKALVQTLQYHSEVRQLVRFGRLGWDKTSHQKWTHESPLSREKSDKWKFQSVQIAAPSFPVCGREGTAPDFFLSLRNEAMIFLKSPLAFNPVVLVAVAADMSADALGHCRIAVERVELMIQSRLSASIARPWGYSFGTSGGFTNAIQDMPTVGLFKIGPMHSRPVELSTFQEQWKLFG